MEGIAIALRAAERVVPAHTLKADGAVVRAINLLELDLIDGQGLSLDCLGPGPAPHGKYKTVGRLIYNNYYGKVKPSRPGQRG